MATTTAPAPRTRPTLWWWIEQILRTCHTGALLVTNLN